jgi:hypothetical protein
MCISHGIIKGVGAKTFNLLVNLSNAIHLKCFEIFKVDPCYVDEMTHWHND